MLILYYLSSCSFLHVIVRTFNTLPLGLYGLSIEDNAANPSEIPVDPASVYVEDELFLSALRNADLTMYSYGAPRTGSPAFTKVNLEGSSAVLIPELEIGVEKYFEIFQCDNNILFLKCPPFLSIELIIYHIILLFTVLFYTCFRNSMSSWTMLSV